VEGKLCSSFTSFTEKSYFTAVDENNKIGFTAEALVSLRGEGASRELEGGVTRI